MVPEVLYKETGALRQCGKVVGHNRIGEILVVIHYLRICYRWHSGGKYTRQYDVSYGFHVQNIILVNAKLTKWGCIRKSTPDGLRIFDEKHSGMRFVNKYISV